MRSKLILGLATALAVWAAGPVAAQAPAADQYFRYTVRPGDTLSALARDYLVSDDYVSIQKLNAVADPRRLPVGSTLLIPQPLLRIETIAGAITSFRGVATIDGQQVEVGTRVRQGQKLETGPNAFVTVTLPDGSAISLPSQSRIHVSRLRRILLTGSIERRFRLEAGRSRATVTPIRDPNSDFQVTTPLSVSAVRGTDFRVALDESGEKALTEVVGGAVEVGKDAQDEEGVQVPRGYGVVATPAGVEQPVALLPPPGLDAVAQTPTGGVLITARPVDSARKYRFQLATDIGFQAVFADSTADAPTISFENLASTQFFIRLSAIAENGLEGLPATYALGQRVGTLDLPWSRVDEERHAHVGAAADRAPSPTRASMSGNAQPISADGTASTPLR
ncbi:MAG: FecR domain-containing protein [Alphaproteobacteria bacterium]